MLFGNFDSLQLDIVGIVAVLGEASVTRNAQASALSKHHLLPRFLPAPQALLKHEQEKRLPTQAGTIVGAYSGRIKFELNYFCQLLHYEPIQRFEVQYVEVKRKDNLPHHPAFSVNHIGPLPALSYIGCGLAIAMLVLSAKHRDGFAMVATVLLAVTSSLTGFASSWKLKFDEEKPKDGREVPDGDVVIYYPREGAFRVVRCDEMVSRLYFKVEGCEYLCGDNRYRALALFASVTLILGLLCMGNSQTKLQVAFAASYILLNILQWGVSAIHPRYHWKHSYSVVPLRVKAPVLKTAKTVTSSQIQPNPILNAVRMNTNVSSTAPHTPLLPVSPTNRFSFPNPTDVPKHTDIETSEVTDLESKEHSSFKERRITTFNSNNTHSSGDNTHKNESELEANVQFRPSQSSFFGSWKGFSQSRPSRTSSHESLPKENPNFTAALWTAIALTGSVRWLKSTHIAPDTSAWDAWIAEAGARARPKYSAHQRKFIPAWTKDEDGCIVLPQWASQERLDKLLAKHQPINEKYRPDDPPLLISVVDKLIGVPIDVRIQLRKLARKAREASAESKKQIAAAAAAAATRNTVTLSVSQRRSTVKIPLITNKTF